MSSQAQRFAKLVLAAFEESGCTTDGLIQQAGGPSSTYMTGLRRATESGELTEPRTDTYRRIERAALWQPGSARLVWLGGDPQPMDSPLDFVSKVASGVYAGPSTTPSGSLLSLVERLYDRVLSLEERVAKMERGVGEGNVFPATSSEPRDLGDEKVPAGDVKESPASDSASRKK